ncbi:MAG: hypothetical protein R3F43_15505 [bacterium]
MRALLAALPLLLIAEPALACSCIEATLRREVTPPDGSRGFPVDGRVRIFLTGFPPALRERLAAEYRLRGPDGFVPLTATVVATRLDLTGALKPHATYTLEQVFAYDSSGLRLSDVERFRSLRGEPAARRLWYPVSTFTTGPGPAGPPPPQPQVERVHVSYRNGGGDCGPGTSLHATFSAAGAGPFDVLELEVDGHGVVATAPAREASRQGATDLGVSDLLCEPDPYSLGKGHQRARVIALGPGPARPKPGRWTDGPQAASSLFGRQARPARPCRRPPSILGSPRPPPRRPRRPHRPPPAPTAWSAAGPPSPTPRGAHRLRRVAQPRVHGPGREARHRSERPRPARRRRRGGPRRRTPRPERGSRCIH